MPAATTRTTSELRQRIGAVGRHTTEGVIASYIHHNGRLGALVEVNCETVEGSRAPQVAALARDIAEHVAAAAPLGVRREDLSPTLVAERRRAFEDELRAHGKAETLIPALADAKMREYLRSVVLLEQHCIREPSVTIRELIDEVAASIGERVQVRRFSRFHMGLA
jgi:elongation factor Ts